MIYVLTPVGVLLLIWGYRWFIEWITKADRDYEDWKDRRDG